MQRHDLRPSALCNDEEIIRPAEDQVGRVALVEVQWLEPQPAPEPPCGPIEPENPAPPAGCEQQLIAVEGHVLGRHELAQGRETSMLAPGTIGPCAEPDGGVETDVPRDHRHRRAVVAREEPGAPAIAGREPPAQGVGGH